MDELFYEVWNKREQERMQGLTPAQRIAEVLHKLLCHWNHDDGCWWEYEKWNGSYHPTKDRYLEKAKELLKVFTEEQVMEFVRICYLAANNYVIQVGERTNGTSCERSLEDRKR